MIKSFLIVSLLLPVLSFAVCPSDSIKKTFVPRSEIAVFCDVECEQGRKLFHSVSLSVDNKVSCATCHDSASDQNYLSDGRARPKPRNDVLLSARTPSLLDVSRTSGPFFWNGRARTLDSQVFWPLYSPQEMGNTPTSLERFGGATRVAELISKFMRTLISSPAPLDDWVKGNCETLSLPESKGAEIVLNPSRCSACHSGTELRGTKTVSTRYFNLSPKFFTGAESTYSSDAELAEATPRGEVVLRTVPPTLRNLKFRGTPLGRFGSHTDLEIFVLEHAKQLSSSGADLSGEEVQNVIKFLQRGSVSFSIR